jgi:pimeloyl-ACP methyl ester carboxylesterase
MSDAIRPFTISVSDDEIADLRDRLARTRWPDPEPVDDWSQGIPLAYTQELCAYWAESYDWRRFEAALNAYDHLLTEIDGVDIHAMHIRSPHEDATPMVLTHGWPGSVAEFMGVIDPLTNPTAHGGSADDAFHLVIPSLPGYGWSGKPAEAGKGVSWIAEAWNTLMVRLGYDSYVAQGGDWGGAVTTYIGMQNLGNARAIHTNMPVAGPTPESLENPTEQEVGALEALGHYDKWDSGYSKQQSTRPQTLGYGLVDSAAGQAAWIAEKMWAWTDNDGHPEDALTKDQMLDNISIYWFTGSGASSARLYWESFADFGGGTVEVPTGCSIFPKEIIRCSRRWAEKRYTNIGYWNELDAGGHFAAWEQPEVFVNEIRSAFRIL